MRKDGWGQNKTTREFLAKVKYKGHGPKQMDVEDK